MHFDFVDLVRDVFVPVFGLAHQAFRINWNAISGPGRGFNVGVVGVNYFDVVI